MSSKADQTTHAGWRKTNETAAFGLGLSFAAVTMMSIYKPFFVDSHFVPKRETVFGRQFYTAFTSMFAHGSLPHLAMNSFLLLQLGRACNNVEPSKLWGVTLGAGVAGTLAHMTILRSPVVGFSGALMGMIGALASADSLHRFKLILPFPGLNITSGQLFDLSLITNVGALGVAIATGRGRNISWIGHLGGTAFSWLGCEIYAATDKRWESISRTRYQRAGREWDASFRAWKDVWVDKKTERYADQKIDNCDSISRRESPKYASGSGSWW